MSWSFALNRAGTQLTVFKNRVIAQISIKTLKTTEYNTEEEKKRAKYRKQYYSKEKFGNSKVFRLDNNKDFCKE